ncbi:hypothetical protein MPNT_10399 [Candidatus Methylacidithermus pantelleriae]|uniref:Uncharacterized protein n=1 Tax=Candidatus Methylacidithermus pantelleriae TaxID=2744239 RepID=A0A8J2BM12_9BACT|nr:hypothetical protein MPNT_10399 [Candidatus Methylacidithermus pantelleriae]
MATAAKNALEAIHEETSDFHMRETFDAKTGKGFSPLNM